MIPYARHHIEDDDIEAVIAALRSGWLTTGPMVEHFEQALCAYTGAQYGVAVSSGTAALHCAMFAIGLEPGDEVIVPSMTFAASANCVAYMGGIPVFAEIDPATLLIDPADVARRITKHTRAIIAVDYAGQPCMYSALRKLADTHGLILIADACHSLGGRADGQNVGMLADLTVFSFHPAKHVATGEGGMVVTNKASFAERARRFRNHGIDSDARERLQRGGWLYRMDDLGFNYRLTDIQCALGISQMHKLPLFLENREIAAAAYNSILSGFRYFTPLGLRDNIRHAYHLYVVKVDFQALGRSRDDVFKQLHKAGIGVNVHYIPVHLHPYYARTYGHRPGDLPITEECYEHILSLPMFGDITMEIVETVCTALRSIDED